MFQCTLCLSYVPEFDNAALNRINLLIISKQTENGRC